MSRQVVHQVLVQKRQHGQLTTSLCGRLRTMSDGMNLGDGQEVTCKFCLKLRAAAERQSERKS